MPGRARAPTFTYTRSSERHMSVSTFVRLLVSTDACTFDMDFTGLIDSKWIETQKGKESIIWDD